MSAAEVGKEIAEHRQHGAAVHDETAVESERHDRWISIVEAVMLSFVAVLAAYSGFAAAKWGTESSISLAKASALRTKASRADLEALVTRTQDSASFNAWFSAFVVGNVKAERVAERRLRPGYRVAFNAWLATDPINNAHAPPGPAYMPQYVVLQQAIGKTDDIEADAAFAEGSSAGGTSDKYIRDTVFLATVLFLVGISGPLSNPSGTLCPRGHRSDTAGLLDHPTGRAARAAIARSSSERARGAALKLHPFRITGTHSRAMRWFPAVRCARAAVQPIWLMDWPVRIEMIGRMALTSERRAGVTRTGGASRRGDSETSEASRPSVADRAARGKDARAKVPRTSHAVFEPSSTRADPIELLEQQAKTRVPELVPIRYGRMLVSPFTFYRGAAMLMAHDLAGTPHSGLAVQCCGDAHLSNFGVFASPERKLVFDVNDFDETLPGPWEWDVKRLAASMLIAAADNGFPVKDQDRIVLDTVGSYRSAMRSFAAMSTLEVWYSHLDIEDTVAEFGGQFKPKMVRRTEKQLAKARTKDSMVALSKLTEVVDGEVRIIDQSPLIVPLSKLAAEEQPDAIREELGRLLRVYGDTLEFDRRTLLEKFELVDVARKVVGVGSVGTRCWIVLMMARGGCDPLFLQVKEADASVLEPLLGASGFRNHGERVIAGQRLMQAESDIFLGWLHAETGLDGQSRDFYVRQLKDWKGSAEIEQMNPKGMAAYGGLCGWTLARAHARSGDPIAIGSYLGGGSSFDHALVEFSKAYAEQNRSDYNELARAVKSGRITAQTGV